MSRQALCFLGALILLSGELFADDEPMTAERLLGLLKASSDRYRSFDVRYDRVHTIVNAGKTTTNSSEITWRWTPTRSYFRKVSDSGVMAAERSGEFGRTLRHKAGQTPRGWIGQMSNFDWEMKWLYTPKRAMWDPIGGALMYSQFPREYKSSVVQDESGLFTLTFHRGQGRDISFVVDPGKGYVITKATVSRATYISSDFREVAPGLWFPFEFGYDGVEYRVREVRVNEQIDASKFALTFPPGTNVEGEWWWHLGEQAAMPLILCVVVLFSLFGLRAAWSALRRSKHQST